MIIKLDREYEVKCTLGTIRDIEKSFNKSFFEVVSDIQKMKTDEQVKLLYIGIKRANAELTYDDFMAKCEDNLGIGDLLEYIEKYFYALQYPGLTQEEVQDKIQKKQLQVNQLQANRALIGNL